MGLVTFTPFGRGLVSNKTAHIQTPYNTMVTLSNANMDWSNFHPNAGIHETFILMNHHQHQDDSLAVDCVGNKQLNAIAGSTDNSRVLHTQAPKTLVLFGRPTYSRAEANDGKVQRIDFASTSILKQTFAPGTQPVVFLSEECDSAASSPVRPYSLWIVGIDSQGFDFVMNILSDTPAGWTYGTIYLNYIAIGSAPGFLARPEG